VTCHYCRTTCKRFGKHRNGLQRFHCNQCRKTFTEEHERPLDAMRLPPDRAVAVLKLLLEGMSVRSVERVTDVHRDTILRLLTLAGERCQRLMKRKSRALTCAMCKSMRFGASYRKKRGIAGSTKRTCERSGMPTAL